jgi:hypothetical protein
VLPLLISSKALQNLEPCCWKINCLQPHLVEISVWRRREYPAHVLSRAINPEHAAVYVVLLQNRRLKEQSVLCRSGGVEVGARFALIEQLVADLSSDCRCSAACLLCCKPKRIEDFNLLNRSPCSFGCRSCYNC